MCSPPNPGEPNIPGSEAGPGITGPAGPGGDQVIPGATRWGGAGHGGSLSALQERKEVGSSVAVNTGNHPPF